MVGDLAGDRDGGDRARGEDVDDDLGAERQERTGVEERATDGDLGEPAVLRIGQIWTRQGLMTDADLAAFKARCEAEFASPHWRTDDQPPQPREDRS